MSKKLDIGSKSFIVYKGKIRKAYIVGYTSFIERIITNAGLPSLRGLISIIVGLIEKAWKNDWELDVPKLKSTIDFKALSILLQKNLTRTSIEDVASYFSVMAKVAMRTEDKKVSEENVTINRIFPSRKEALDSPIYKKATKELPEFKFELGFDIKKKLKDSIREQLGGDINKVILKGFVRSTIMTLDLANIEESDEDDIEALKTFSKLASNDNWSFGVSDGGSTVIFTKEKFIGGRLGVQTLYSGNTIREKFRVREVLQDYIDFLNGNFNPAKYNTRKQTVSPLGLADLQDIMVVKIENSTYENGTNPEISHALLDDGLNIDLFIHKEKFLEKLVEMGYDREDNAINEDMVFGNFVRNITGKITKGELFSKQLYSKRKHFLSSFEVKEIGVTSNVFHARLYMGRSMIFLKSNYVVNVSFVIEHLDNLKFNFLTRFRISGKTNLNLNNSELKLEYFDKNGNELVDLEVIDYIYNPVITVKVSEVSPIAVGDSYSFNIKTYNNDESITSPLLSLDSDTPEVSFDLNLGVFNTKRNNFTNVFITLLGAKEIDSVTDAIRAFDNEIAINYNHNGNNAGIDIDISKSFTETPISYQDTVSSESFSLLAREHILLKHLLVHIVHFPNGSGEWLDITPDGWFDKELEIGEVYKGNITLNFSKLKNQSQGHVNYTFVPIYLQNTQLKLPIDQKDNSIPLAEDIILSIVNEDIFSFMNNETFSLVNYNNSQGSVFVSNNDDEQQPDNIVTVEIEKYGITKKIFYGRKKYTEVNSLASAITYCDSFISDFIDESIPIALSYDDMLSGFTFLDTDTNTVDNKTYIRFSYKTVKNSTGMQEVPLTTEMLNKLSEALEDSTFSNDKFGLTLENFSFAETELVYPFEITFKPVPYLSYLAVKKGFSVFDKVWFLKPLPKIPLKLIREGIITAVEFNRDLSGDFRTVDIKLATADLDYKVLGCVLPNLTESLPPKTPLDQMKLYTVKDRQMYPTFEKAQSEAMQILCPICLTFKNKPSDNDLTLTESLDFLSYLGSLGEDGKAPESEASIEEIKNVNKKFESDILNSTRRFELDRNPSPSNSVSSSYDDERETFTEIDTTILKELEKFALPPDEKVSKSIIRHNPPLDKVAYDELMKLSVVTEVAGVSSVSQLIQRKREKEAEALDFAKRKLTRFNISVLDLKLLLGDAADHIIICVDCQQRIMNKLGELSEFTRPNLPETGFDNPRITTKFEVNLETYIDLEFMNGDSIEVKEVNTFKKPATKKQKKVLEDKVGRKVKKLD